MKNRRKNIRKTFAQCLVDFRLMEMKYNANITEEIKTSIGNLYGFKTLADITEYKPPPKVKKYRRNW